MLTRMRGMLEDENSTKRAQMMKQMQEENKRLALQKKQREQQWREDQERQNQLEIINVNNSDIMTENPNTTVSQLADHRYVPYHFKGLNPNQKDNIMQIRQQQVQEARDIKDAERQEELQWALQHEANRQLLTQNELALDEKKRQHIAEHKAQAKVDKIAKEQKWSNYYGDKDPLPQVQW